MNFFRNNPIIGIILIGFTLILIFVNSLIPHVENDEVVYQTLVKQISCQKWGCVLPDLSKYSLQKTKILEILDRNVYDKPLFFRPPAFTYTLALIYPIFHDFVFILFPAIFYLLIIIVCYECVYSVSHDKNASLRAMLLAVTNPFFLFHVFHVWTDLYLALMMALSFLFVLQFRINKKATYVLLSGFFFVIACLTKYQAMLILPLLLIIIYKSAKGNLSKLMIFFISWIILLMWGVYVNQFHPTIQFLLSSNPSKRDIEQFPFVAYVVARPIYYYVTSLFLIAPIYVLYLYQILVQIRKMIVNHESVKYLQLLVFIFIVVSVAVMTGIAASGSSYQSRYILFIQPFLVFLCAHIKISDSTLNRLIFMILLFIGIITSFISIWQQNAEVFSIVELLRLVR